MLKMLHFQLKQYLQKMIHLLNFLIEKKALFSIAIFMFQIASLALSPIETTLPKIEIFQYDEYVLLPIIVFVLLMLKVSKFRICFNFEQLKNALT